jgi:glutamine---fructose-6-phosphate transaminase (isomerizing)
MCGIVGFTGNREATPIILDGLKKLEYRGYDSAGICTITGGKAEIRRTQGKLDKLEQLIYSQPLAGRIGIGHTRWATHGRPSEINAHPHKAKTVTVVHNGIIENYLELKERLKAQGCIFSSETDTEVISHLIEEKVQQTGKFEEGVRLALQELRGAYALCILCEKEPDTLIAAKNGSPLVIGLGDGEFFVASDIPPILSHTRSMVFLEDGEMAIFNNRTFAFSTISGQQLIKKPRYIDWSPMMAEKGGYKHFMLKEIFEQPRAIQDTLAGRLMEENGDVFLNDLRLSSAELGQFKRIYLIACGTSWHAALVGKFYIEGHCRIPVEVDIASEFRYRNPVVNDKTLLIIISQSGETADSLAAMREGKARGGTVIAICNVVDSSIARMADGIIYTHAGPEIGVASTKAFVTQLAALYLFTIRLGRATGAIKKDEGQTMIASLVRLPSLLEKALEMNPLVEKVARRYMNAQDFLFLGRGIFYPIALEGALKLKEISYIHAEGYPAGEMKHGPIALIDENMPVVILAPKSANYEKVVSNLEEVIARDGRVIAVVSAGDEELKAKAEIAIEVPVDGDDMTAIFMSVPLQLLAYHVAVLKGTDVDQPRNLAKSVTVE